MTGIAKTFRVLVAVDFDEASAAALKVAGSLVAAWGAELTVFRAETESVPAYFTASQIGQLEAERQQDRASIADQVRIFAERQVPVAVNVVVADGPPQDAIVRIAGRFDLIAVGTHRRIGPQRWWLGSVAEAVVRQSPRPVLVVPAAGSVLATRRLQTILVAGGDGAVSDVWADLFKSALGGSVVRELSLQQCEPNRLEHADVIVLSMPAHASRSQLKAITHVLKECVHPVLFIPSSEEIVERSPS